VGDDTTGHGIVGEEGDNKHFPLSFGKGHGNNLIDHSYHLCLASTGDPRALLLNDDGWMLIRLSLAHLAPVRIGIEAKVTDGDLTLVWKMGGNTGDKLQIIHPLHLGGLFPIPTADLAFFLRKRQTLQRKILFMLFLISFKRKKSSRLQTCYP
jgi:hypothetical protein